MAVQIMEHLCSCAEHGYSQPGRYGTSGYCTVQTDAGPIKVKKGDRDCSSAVCEAWELALVGTGYEGRITRYNWTGGMREAFLASGLFTWESMSFNASRGDVYLDEQNHTAMCVQNDAGADLLAEFSISETGGIDGEPGDQTGREASVPPTMTTRGMASCILSAAMRSTRAAPAVRARFRASMPVQPTCPCPATAWP